LKNAFFKEWDFFLKKKKKQIKETKMTELRGYFPNRSSPIQPLFGTFSHFHFKITNARLPVVRLVALDGPPSGVRSLRRRNNNNNNKDEQMFVGT